MTLVWRKFIFAVVILTTTALASASDFDGGTESPLRFGVGARELSLGGSVIAGCDPATAPFWNPAMLARAEYLSFTGFHANLFDSDVTYQYTGFAWPTVDFGTFGIGIQRLGVQGIERRDSENMLIGEFSDDRYGLHLAWGTQWNSYQIGLAIGLEHHSLDDYSATSTPGVNFAIMRTFASPLGFCRDLTGTVVAKNILGGSVQLYEETSDQPTLLEAGFDLGLFPDLSEQHDIELFAKMTKIDEIDPRLALGLEYTYANMLGVRGGLRDNNWSLGVGINYRGIGFDYAVVDRELGILHMFTLTTSFGSSTAERRRLRAEHRETEFRNRMQEQVNRKNKTAVEELVQSGQESVNEGDLAHAVSDYQRALFIAKSSGIDTTNIGTLLEASLRDLDRERQMSAHDIYLDSAQYYFSIDQALTAQYFVNQALSVFQESSEAIALRDRIDHVLKESEVRESMVTDQVHQIDSLLAYGLLEMAVARAQSLAQLVPDDERVINLLKRSKFDSIREQGDLAFVAGDYATAGKMIDEAESLFPKHQWSVSLRKRIKEAKNAMVAKAQALTKPAVKKQPLSDAVLKQVDDLYRDGQAAFDKGNFENAINIWERVEALAPDYFSVRQYLVEAYKFLGVEHYGNNELEQALELWRRALDLVPDNQEIASYIKRTESEMTKIQELTYEQ